MSDSLFQQQQQYKEKMDKEPGVSQISSLQHVLFFKCYLTTSPVKWGQWSMNVYAALMERYWQQKTEVIGEPKRPLFILVNNNITSMTNTNCCEYSIKTPDDGH
jgi:hypothetical protein